MDFVYYIKNGELKYGLDVDKVKVILREMETNGDFEPKETVETPKVK